MKLILKINTKQYIVYHFDDKLHKLIGAEGYVPR